MSVEDLHDQLMKEFRKYFEDYQDWAAHETHASGIRTRQHLYEIRRIALEMRKEILEVRRLKPKLKSPKYKESLLKDQMTKKT
jgi:hypothetical protein